MDNLRLTKTNICEKQEGANSYDTANNFNNYFVSLTETANIYIYIYIYTKNIYTKIYKYSYPTNESGSTIYLQPANKEETANISSQL